ncbi:MAG: Na+/H+ antiporter NhaA [Hyphomonadaceae bacterium]|nr:Na+/H+ antiporter NhaA [Hyphomonadaceae bacterium]
MATKTKWYARDATPGYVLLAATALSFLLNNSIAGDAFRTLLNANVDIPVGGFVASTTLAKLIKNALMAVFFLYVGLELKRECIEGPFRNPKEAALPAMGALGGMAAPALVYLLVATVLHPAAGPQYAQGWAIPTATDIAFAIGVLSLLGPRVPSGLRLFLLALAIADDLGAILVIAIFYSGAIAMAPAALALVLFGALMAMNRFGVTKLWPYAVGGVALWGAMAGTGVSPTLAGVLTAIAVPMRRPDGGSPLIDAEHALKTPVQLGVMPIFALAVAGVAVEGDGVAAALAHPVTLGIAFGLLLGKPLGIVLFTWLGAAVLRQKPPCSWPNLTAVALVAGIGFTMSLFVGALAFPDHPELEAPVRFGVLGGSLLAAAVGLLLLNIVLPRHRAADPGNALSRDEDLAEERGVLENQD